MPQELPENVFRDPVGILAALTDSAGLRHEMSHNEDHSVPEEPPKDLLSATATQMDQPPVHQEGIASSSSSFEVRAHLEGIF
jgi:hypothetical protein